MQIRSGLGRALIFELIFFFPFSALFGVAQFLYFAPDFLKPLRGFPCKSDSNLRWLFLTEFISSVPLTSRNLPSDACKT